MSCSLVFSDLIKQVGEWSQHNFGNQKGAGALAPLAGIVEEIGELQEAVAAEDKIDAFVDMAVFLADVCARSGVVVHHTLLGKYSAKPFRPAVSLGKLSHAVLKLHQGIRGAKKEDVKKAADLLIKDIVSGYYHSLSLVLGNERKVEPFDWQVEKVWNKVRLRDWKKWPETGRPPLPKAIGNSAAIANFTHADFTHDELRSLKMISNTFLKVRQHWSSPAVRPSTFQLLAESNGHCYTPIQRGGPRFVTRKLGNLAVEALQTFPQLDDVRSGNPLPREWWFRAADSAEVFKRVCEYPTRGKVYVQNTAEFKTPRLDPRSKEILSMCRILSTFKTYQGNTKHQDVFQYDCGGYYK